MGRYEDGDGDDHKIVCRKMEMRRLQHFMTKTLTRYWSSEHKNALLEG
jgi:hypothetical protein